MSRALEGKNWLTRRWHAWRGLLDARLEAVRCRPEAGSAALGVPGLTRGDCPRAVLEGAEAQADPEVAYFGPFSEQVSGCAESDRSSGSGNPLSPCDLPARLESPVTVTSLPAGVRMVVPTQSAQGTVRARAGRGGTLLIVAHWRVLTPTLC